MGFREDIASCTVKVLLGRVVNETDDVAVFVDCNQAGAHGDHVFDLRKVVWVKFWLARLHGECVLEFFNGNWPFGSDDPGYDLFGEISLVCNLSLNAFYRATEGVVIGFGAQRQFLESYPDRFRGYFPN